MANKLPIHIRDAELDDVNFIFSSWLKSFRSGLMNKHVDNTIYYAEHHKVIERILKRSNVKIACSADDVAQIIGWLCFEHIDGILTIHYAYTKQSFRNLGIQREILKALKHDFNLAGLYTHDTPQATRLAPKYNLIYHPYILVNYNEIAGTKMEDIEDTKRHQTIHETIEQTKGEIERPELNVEVVKVRRPKKEQLAGE